MMNGSKIEYHHDTSAEDRCKKRSMQATCIAPVQKKSWCDIKPLDCWECSDDSSLSNNKTCACNDGHEVGSSNQCTPCPKGKYKDSTELESCSLCPKGWYNNEIGQRKCSMCPEGYYSSREGQTRCQSCDEGSYSENKGQQKCEICDRGRTSIRGAVSCEYCPYAFTTYKHLGNGNICIGPKVDILYDQKQYNFIVPFKYNLRRSYMKSIFDWKLYRSNHRTYSLKEKHTTLRGRKIRYKNIVRAEPVLEDIVCYTNKGYNYKGLINYSRDGNKCTTGYCRNTRYSTHQAPYCWTDNGDEPCDVPKCAQKAPTPSCTYKQQYSSGEPQQLASYSILNLRKSDAQDVCDKLAQNCVGIIGLTNGFYGIVSRISNESGSVAYYKKDDSCEAPYYSAIFAQSWNI